MSQLIFNYAHVNPMQSSGVRAGAAVFIPTTQLFVNGTSPHPLARTGQVPHIDTTAPPPQAQYLWDYPQVSSVINRPLG